MSLNRRQTLAGFALFTPAVTLAAASSTRAQTPARDEKGYDNYVQQTLLLGAEALEQSLVAKDMATDPNVRQFAELEIAEQQTIASILAATAAGGQPPSLPADRLEAVRQMQQMPRGRDFDRAYVEGQITGHTGLLAVQQKLSGETSASVEAITARLAQQGITSHIAMLNIIQQLLGAEDIQNIQEGKNPDGTTGAPATDGAAAPQSPAEGQSGSTSGNGG